MRTDTLLAGEIDQIDVFTDLQPTLTFNFGDRMQRLGASNRVETASSSIASLNSMNTHPMTVRQTGAIYIIAVTFHPGALSAFLPMPIDETADLTVDLRDVFGPSADDLTHLLFEASDNPSEQAALLDMFLLYHLNPTDLYTFAQSASPLLLDPTTSVKALARESGYSARNLNRIFRAVYGITPKTYARIARFRQAYHTLQYAPSTDLTTLAHSHGYYDLSHFSREFKAYTGVAPSQYRQQMSDLYKRFREANATITPVNNELEGIS